MVVRAEMQAACDKIFFNHRAGLITRQQFKDQYDKLYFKFNDCEKRSVDARINRMYLRIGETKTLGQYALKILDNTIRESKLVALGSLIFGFTYTDMGVDNTGRLIIDTNLLTGKPDFCITFNGMRKPTELKFCPSFNTFTFGKRQADMYIACGAHFLVFVYEFGMIGPNGDPKKSSEYDIKTHGLWVALTSPEQIIKIRERPLVSTTQQPGDKSYQLKTKKEIVEFFGLRLVNR